MNAIMLAKQVQNVFSLPDAVVRINEILDADDVNIADLEDIILHDPAMTAKMLKIVNSPYYGLSNKVDSISGAIKMLGLDELRNLVMEVSVASQFENIPSDLVDMDAYWYHSVVRGVLAKILAKHFKFEHYERLYIAGLLSGIGKLVLFTQFPEQSKQVLGLQDQSDEAVFAMEKKLFGFGYAELSAELLKSWKLPAEIWQTIYYQFDPLNENSPKSDACLLHVAVKISNTIQPCRNQRYDITAKNPGLNPGVLEYLGLTPEVIESATTEALVYPWEILSILHPSAMSIF